MITVFHILVFLLSILVMASFVTQKHKIPVFCVGLLAGILGFYIESFSVSNGAWTWYNSGGGILGVPHIVTLTYFLGGLLVASLAVNLKVKTTINKISDKLCYFVLIPIGILYGIYSKDFAFLFLALAVFFYSKYNKDIYFIMVAAIIAGGDLIAENLLIYLGHITYTNGYTATIYLGFFVGTILLMSLTDFIAKKTSKIRLK